MASHSSSSIASAQPSFSYDVFLSFRGEDTRDSFTDHLYTALNRSGIRTFRDDTIKRGKLLKPKLKKAIHESAISLIVFSEGYASSNWCLDEVTMVIEEHETSSGKHQLVPVFYKVEPSDVRHQRGSFRDSFDAYNGKIEAETNLEKKKELLEKVRAWRDSLYKATLFTGWVYKDGYESNFINNIVNVLRKKLDYKCLYIEEKLVGIEDHAAKIKSWLQDPSPDAVILLIDGMGGIGKSTIAKCIYNSNSGNYGGSCFLANINEASNQPGGLLRLQSQLLSTILKSDKEETIWSVLEGTNKITRAISNKKVLLILDDVATENQLNALLGHQRFCLGSKVIITTRCKDLRTAFTVHPKVHPVRTLSTAAATELFSMHAFHQHQPIEPYISQSQVFVDHCNGLPLALKVLGSSLRGKTIFEWKDTLRRLEATPDPEIQKVLEVSYESLKHDTDKKLFLHIACFFEGQKEDYIVKLLVECGLFLVVGIKNLMDRCLLYVEDGRVMMHQLIKEMGREIVHQESPEDPGKRTRLWHHQDCIDVLQDQSGTEKVEGLMLDLREMEKAKWTRSFNNFFGKRMHGNNANFEIGSLEKMKNLKLLQLNYVTFSGECKKLPRKLVLLRWHGCSLEAIPSDSCLEKLVVLDMSHSKLKHLWDGLKHIGSLKILNLSHSHDLIKTPNFGGLLGLESLILRGCSSLIKVHESIAYLKELVMLDLTDCTSLRDCPCLPTSLVSLEMSGCPNVGFLGPVQCMHSVPSFSHLHEMNLSHCNLFDNSFPNDLSSLVSLLYLDISGNSVTYLPKCIQTLPRIVRLNVKSCSKIRSILGLPESLQSLIASCNDSLEKIQLNRWITNRTYIGCPKLWAIEGHCKVISIDKVERKIIQYLGLESNASTWMKPGLKVLHEFGIFSTCVSGTQIPSDFMRREKGPQISYEVPWHDDSLRISGFNMCVVLSQSSTSEFCSMKIDVYNKTKNILLKYSKGHQIIPENVESYAWVSLWRCGDLLEEGDEIVISIIDTVTEINPRRVVEVFHQAVEECGIRLLYEYNEQHHGESKEAHNVNVCDQMLWSDRMHVDISNYVYRGKHLFYNLGWYEPGDVTANYWKRMNKPLSLEMRTMLSEIIIPD